MIGSDDLTPVRGGIDVHFLEVGEHIPGKPCTCSEILV
jgi:hypothetical protein